MSTTKKSIALWIAFSLCTLALPATTHADTTSGLVGYWTFDGKDTNWTTNTTSDRSGNGNTGTLTNMSTTTSPTVGKLGQALKFDGVDDQVIAPFNSVTNITGTNPLTIAAWIKPDIFSATKGGIAGNGKVGTGGYVAVLLNTRVLRFCKNSVVCIDSASAIYPNSLNTWHHVVFAVTNIGVDYYIDGVYQGTTTNAQSILTDVTTGPYISSVRRLVGDDTFFSGSIDDVRIYNRALSATDVAQLYKQGASKYATSPTTSLTSGLVGYWTFDGKDTNWTTNTTSDRSGNGNTGTLTNMSTTTSPTVGKLGQALTFLSASSRQVTIPYNSLLNVYPMTASAWVKTTTNDSSARGIVGKYVSGQAALGGYLLFLYQGNLRGWYFRDGGNNVWDGAQGMNAGAINDGIWHLTTLVVDSSGGKLFVDGKQKDSRAWTGTAGAMTNTNPACIGLFTTNSSDCLAGSFFNGLIDDVRIYNRALSATDVAQLYKQGASKYATSPTTSLTSGLVGYWTFDGKDTNWTTNTTSDRSGNGNTGTLTNMSTTTSPTVGKLGQALKFDGVDDYVDLGSNASLRPTGSMSICAWAPMYHSGGSRGYILSNDGNSGAKGYDLSEYSINGSLDAFSFSIAANSTTGIAVNSTSRTGSNGGIFHVCGVYDAPNQTTTMYVNATIEGTKTSADGIPASQYNQSSYGNPKIGNRGQLSGSYFRGSLDEVRVYNRALSATEITNLYKLGRTTAR